MKFMGGILVWVLLVLFIITLMVGTMGKMSQREYQSYLDRLQWQEAFDNR